MHTYIHTYIHTYTHAYIHACIYTYILRLYSTQTITFFTAKYCIVLNVIDYFTFEQMFSGHPRLSSGQLSPSVSNPHTSPLPIKGKLH